LAHANEHRDWRIYADFAQILMPPRATSTATEPFGVELSETVYASWTPRPSICVCRFSLGKISSPPDAVKLHTLAGSASSIPTNVYVTGGQVHDVNILDQLLPEPERFTCDRG